MQIQLIRNATLRMTYGNHAFITDPYLAPRHSQEPLIGKSRNPIVDLPFPAEEVLAGIEMALISHLHPDHFDSVAQQRLPPGIQIYCQPGDESQIKEAGFTKITASRKDLRALAEAEGIEASQLHIPADGETLAF